MDLIWHSLDNIVVKSSIKDDIEGNISLQERRW